MPGPFTDPNARIWILSGDEWAPRLMRAMHDATDSVLVSVYMISHHWRGPARIKTNLLDELLAVSDRSLTCRAVLGQPPARLSREVYNVDAGRSMVARGWKVRMMQSSHVLHEKFILIDKRIAVVGSHNISRSSVASNYDTSLAIESEIVGAALYRVFWERWRQASPFTG